MSALRQAFDGIRYHFSNYKPLVSIAVQIRQMPSENLHDKLNTIFNRNEDVSISSYRVDKDLNLFVPDYKKRQLHPPYKKYKNKNQSQLASRIEKLLRKYHRL